MPPTPVPLDPSWRPVGREDVEFRQLAGDWILYDPETRHVAVLDAVDALVWSMCTGERSVRTLEADVRAAFGLAYPAGSVERAVAGFRDAGLLQSTG